MSLKRKPLVVVTRRLAGRGRDADARAVRRAAQPRRRPALARADRRRHARGGRAGSDRYRQDRVEPSRAGGPEPAIDRQLRQRRRPYRRRRRARARHHRHQHARRPHGGYGRHDHGADPRGRPARSRGCAHHPGRRLDYGLVADLDAGAPHHRQAPRNRRHGPDRAGARPPRQGVRPSDPLSQPPPRPGRDRSGAGGDLLGIARPDAWPASTSSR